MRTDEEDEVANNPSPFYGGTFHMSHDVHGELYEAQEFSTDVHEDESYIGDKQGTSRGGSRKSSTTPPSPEGYESSPRTERQYYTNSGKYIVTSI